MSLFDTIKSAIFGDPKTAISGATNRAANTAFNSATQNVKSAIQTAATHETKSFVFNTLPTNLEELKALPEATLKDPFAVAALAIVAFAHYSTNKAEALEMINFLKGPESLSVSDMQLVDERLLGGRDYVIRSYFEGAIPDNDYTPAQPYKINITQMAHSRDQLSQGYYVLFVRSGGADSPRQIKLRTKPSTGEWFLWEQSSIIMDIRIPRSANKWA